MNNQDRLFKLFQRVMSTIALLALVAVVKPCFYMNAIHHWLGIGELPTELIVGYLARSVSAFYTMFGGLLWVVSFDLSRHRLVLCYIGAAVVFFGIILFIVDLREGIPLWRSLGEGPIDTAFGVILLILCSCSGTVSSL